MFTLGGGAKIFLATGATDLRRGFSLYTVVEHQLGCRQPLNGDVYGFVNRRRDLVKLFWFSEGGMYVCAKRRTTPFFFTVMAAERGPKVWSMVPGAKHALWTQKQAGGRGTSGRVKLSQNVILRARWSTRFADLLYHNFRKSLSVTSPSSWGICHLVVACDFSESAGGAVAALS